jgi:hypothetical protein
MTPVNKSFIVEYSNKDIMDKLEHIDNKLSVTQSLARKAQLYASAALGLSIIVLGYLVYHIMQTVN